ncbi:MAG: DUF1343 domain-containing protein [Acidobacteriota bacterium]|nr:DUF1343 domain-containing protein [Acidobacteriota bacterium]
MKLLYLVLALLVFCVSGYSFNESVTSNQTRLKNEKIITGAEQPDEYLPYLKGKRVGILANQTAINGDKHLVDFLLSKGVNVVKVFGPEHGFRGNASAGVKVADEKDPATGIKIISLYGSKRKPTQEDLADIDVMIYDVQDVGCRFYTNINVLRDLMESCAEFKKELIILDRPNPNGYLIDGPVLDMSLKSGIGQFPVPISHGMTIAEFAQMINGEGWLPNKAVSRLKIVKVRNYSHDMEYVLPVKPSPNLNTQQSVMLYPSTCLFEGTILNHGRGTFSPFAVLGNPLLKEQYAFSFTPVGIPGMSETPLHMNEVCYGLDLRNYDTKKLRKSNKLNLKWMMELYKAYPDKQNFFNKSLSKEIGDIDKLSGTRNFKEQIIAGKTEEEIRKSWEPGLSNYKKTRKKYLLYK